MNLSAYKARVREREREIVVAVVIVVVVLSFHCYLLWQYFVLNGKTKYDRKKYPFQLSYNFSVSTYNFSLLELKRAYNVLHFKSPFPGKRSKTGWQQKVYTKSAPFFRFCARKHTPKRQMTHLHHFFHKFHYLKGKLG